MRQGNEGTRSQGDKGKGDKVTRSYKEYGDNDQGVIWTRRQVDKELRGQGNKWTRGQGDKGTRRQGDNKTRRQGRRQGEKAAESPENLYFHNSIMYVFMCKYK